MNFDKKEIAIAALVIAFVAAGALAWYFYDRYTELSLSTSEAEEFGCAPLSQSVAINQDAILAGSGDIHGQYNWSAPGGSPSTGTGPSFSVRYAVTGTKTVTVHGTYHSATCTVVVGGDHTPTPTPGTFACSPKSQTRAVNENASLIGSGDIHNSYTWSAPGGNPSTGTGPSFATRYATSGTKNVHVQGTYHGDDCTVTIVATPTPTPTPSPLQIACSPIAQEVSINQSASLTGSGGSAAPGSAPTYTWSASGGTPSSGTTQGNFQAFTTRYATSGSKRVTMSNGGGSVECAINVKSTITPTPTPTPVPLACSPKTQTVRQIGSNLSDPAAFTVSGGTGAPGSQPVYTWSAPEGTPSSGTGQSFSTKYGLPPGVKTVTVANGGQASSCMVSVIHGDPSPTPTPTPTPSPLQIACSPIAQEVSINQSASLTGSGGSAAPGSAPTYTWSASGGTPSSGTTQGNFQAFTTRYATSGSKRVTMSNGGGSVECAINVKSTIIPPLPGIKITKTANPTTLPAGGGNAIYTYTVVNTGSATLSNVSMQDDRCAPVTYVSGDTNYNNNLETTEVWSYSCSASLTTTTLNTATVSAVAGGATVRSSDSETVIVQDINPVRKILIEKLGANITRQDGSPRNRVDASPGDILKFTIQVISESNISLQSVVVRDIIPNGLSYQSGSTQVDGVAASDGIAGAGINIGSLAPNEIVTISFLVAVNDPSAFQAGTTVLVNTAIVRSEATPEVDSKIPVYVTKNVLIPVGKVKTGVDGATITLLASLVLTFGYQFARSGVAALKGATASLVPSHRAVGTIVILLGLLAGSLTLSSLLAHSQVTAIEIKSPIVRSADGSYFGLITNKLYRQSR